MKKKKAPPPTQQLGARIPMDLYKRLAHYAVDHERQQRDVLAEAIEEYLKTRRARNDP